MLHIVLTNSTLPYFLMFIAVMDDISIIVLAKLGEPYLENGWDYSVQFTYLDLSKKLYVVANEMVLCV